MTIEEEKKGPARPPSYFDKGRLLAWCRRDLIYILACVFCLGAAIYTMYFGGDYNAQCNTHWTQEMERLGCADYATFDTAYEPPFGEEVKTITGATQ